MLWPLTYGRAAYLEYSTGFTESRHYQEEILAVEESFPWFHCSDKYLYLHHMSLDGILTLSESFLLP